MPLVTGVMTQEDYGLSESLVSLAELLIPLLTLGLQDAVFRFTMMDDVSPKGVLSTTLTIVLGGFSVLIVGSGLAMFKLNPQYCMLFAGLFVCVSLSNIWGQFVRGLGRIKVFALSGIVQALTLALSTFVFVYHLRWGGIGYILALIIAYSSSLLILFFPGHVFKNISIKSFDKKLLKRMIKYAAPLVPNMLSWWFVQVVNRFILIYYLGEGAAGVFVANSKISSLINIFGTIFLQAWTISTVKTINQEDKGEFNSGVYRNYATFLQLATSGIMLLLPLLSAFLLKGEFAETWQYSAVPIYTALISCFTAFFGAYYGAALNNRMVFVSTLAGAVVNVVMCVILTKFVGILGAMFASMLAYVVMTTIRMVDSQKYSNIKIKWVKEIPVFVLVFGQVMVALLYRKMPMWAYYVANASVFGVICLIKFKEIKEIVLTMVGLLKKLFGHKNAIKEVSNEEEINVDIKQDNQMEEVIQIQDDIQKHCEGEEKNE